MCTVPQKCLFVWGISCTSYLSALGSQARTVLFSSDMSFLLGFDPFLGSLWILSHIDKKCTPRMPYKLLLMWDRIQRLPKNGSNLRRKLVSVENKTVLAWLPKADK